MHLDQDSSRRAVSLGIVALLVGASFLAFVPGTALAEDSVLMVGRTLGTIKVDGVADEAAWGDATMTRVTATKASVPLPGDVELKALYDEQNVYMLVKWTDQSHSVNPDQWLYTAQEWQSIHHKEDRFSILWDSDKSIEGFDQNFQGCNVLECHTDTWQTKNAGEWGDLWQWMAGRTNPSKRTDNVGWMDDLSVDTEGMVEDDYTGSTAWKMNSHYATDDNPATEPFADGDYPFYKASDEPPPNPDANFLFDGYTMTIIDPSSFDDQTTLPGWVLNRPTGDRGDIDAKAVYDTVLKTWTLEIKRKLVTAHESDIAFDDLTEDYYFGLSVFDNQAGGVSTHYNSGLVTMRFDLPDLKVEPLNVTTASPVLGSRVNVSVTLRNAGAYAEGFTLGLFLDTATGTPIATKVYTSMNDSASAAFNLTWDTTGVAVGEHKLIVKADTVGVIVEHDKANNVAEYELVVYPPITDFKASKMKPESGQKTTLTATIDNPSSANMTVTVVFTDVTKTTVLNTKVVEVKAGKTENVTFIWKAAKTGKHTIEVMLQGSDATKKPLVIDVKEASPAPPAAYAMVALALVGAALVVHRMTAPGRARR
jgi:hypothetical protein